MWSVAFIHKKTIDQFLHADTAHCTVLESGLNQSCFTSKIFIFVSTIQQPWPLKKNPEADFSKNGKSWNVGFANNSKLNSFC
jgi:hypothetical protein